MKTELRPAIIPKEEWEAFTNKVKEPRPKPTYGKETVLPVEQILLPYGVGIDTHKKFIQICVLRKEGEELRSSEREMTTHWKTLGKAADWINEKLGQKQGDPFNYTIESTGCYHIPVLLALKGNPSVVNPLLAGKTHRKTDVLDARMLARQAITGLWPKSFIPSRVHETLRVMNNEYREATRNATRAILRANNIILRFGHTIGADMRVKNLEAIELMNHLAMGRLPKHEGISIYPLTEGAQNALSWMLQTHQQFKMRAKEVQKKAIQYIGNNSWPQQNGTIQGEKLLENLQTVPGVGELTAIQWISQVGDPTRFASAPQVAAFCGFDPTLKVSAGKVTETTRRRGNKAIHIAIARAAIPVLTKPKEPFGEWGASIAGRHKKGGFMKARNAIARRIATSLWWVHMKGEAFSYEKYKLNQQQPVPIITLKEMGLDRYKTILAAFQIYNSEQVIRAWMKGKLKDIPGFGDVAFATVQGWYERNKGKQTQTTNNEDNEEFKRAASLSVPARLGRSGA